jgi:hypothetical protein
MPDKVKTKLDKSGDVKAYSQTAIVNNNGVIEYCRTSMAALSGSTAGILGLPTLYGFVFYALSVVGKNGIFKIKLYPINSIIIIIIKFIL